MKKLVLLAGTLLCCAMAYARPQFIEATRELRVPDLDFTQADVDGDWILARGAYKKNVDPNDDWNFDWWEKLVLFHRDSSGEWQLVQTLSDEYLIFNSDEHFPDPHDLALANGVAAFSTNSGLHMFELVAGTWVPRNVTGAAAHPPVDLDFDGITLLAADGSCETAATAFTRQSDGSWAAQGDLIGQAQCDEYFQRYMAVSGSRALVHINDQNVSAPNERFRLFERSGGAWLPTGPLPPPPTPDIYLGAPVALRGDVALVGGDGTHIYKRDASGFVHTGKIPLLVYALDRAYAADLKIGPQFALQAYPGPSTTSDIAVLQPNSSGNYDHVATLGNAFSQYSQHVSGRRVVSTGGGAVLVYDVPQTFTPSVSTYHDFENGTPGWTAVAGQFAVAQRGATRVYRQSSLTGDAAAVNSADLKTTLITADVRPTAFDGDTRWVGLMARYMDENNMYYVTMRANNTISMRKKVNGVITDLYTYQPPVQLNTNYRVAFEVVGNRLTFYDGERQVSVYDQENSLPHGRAGVRTYKATADFDDVIITPVPLMELGGGSYHSAMSMFDVVDGNWSTNGIFNLDQVSTDGNARILHGGSTDDQVVKVAVQPNDFGTGTGSHWVGLMVRYADPSNYYYVTLRSSNDLSLRKVVDGVITELVHVPFSVQAGERYRLRFEAIGTKLLLYVNDEVRLQARDSSLTQGRSGLVTYRAAASYFGYSSFQP